MADGDCGPKRGAESPEPLSPLHAKVLDYLEETLPPEWQRRDPAVRREASPATSRDFAAAVPAVDYGDSSPQIVFGLTSRDACLPRELQTIRREEILATDAIERKGLIGLGPGRVTDFGTTLAPGDVMLRACLARGNFDSLDDEEPLEMKTFRPPQRSAHDPSEVSPAGVGDVASNAAASESNQNAVLQPFDRFQHTSCLQGCFDPDAANAKGLASDARPLPDVLAEQCGLTSSLRGCFALDPEKTGEQELKELKTLQLRRNDLQMTGVLEATLSPGKAELPCDISPRDVRPVPSVRNGDLVSASSDVDAGCTPSVICTVAATPAENATPQPATEIIRSLGCRQDPDDSVLYSSLVKAEEDLRGPEVPTVGSGAIGFSPPSRCSRLESTADPFSVQQQAMASATETAAVLAAAMVSNPTNAASDAELLQSVDLSLETHFTTPVESGFPRAPSGNGTAGSVTSASNFACAAKSQGLVTTAAPSAVTTTDGSPWIGAFADCAGTPGCSEPPGSAASFNSVVGGGVREGAPNSPPECIVASRLPQPRRSRTSGAFMESSNVQAPRNDDVQASTASSGMTLGPGDDIWTSAKRPGGVEVNVDIALVANQQCQTDSSQERLSGLRVPRVSAQMRRQSWQGPGQDSNEVGSAGAVSSCGGASASSTGSSLRRPPRGPPLPPSSSAAASVISAGNNTCADRADTPEAAQRFGQRSGSRDRSRAAPGTQAEGASALGPASRRSLSGPASSRRISACGVQSNRKLIRNALEWYCLKGDANRAQREQVLQAYDTELLSYDRFVILFRSIHTGRHDFRGLYGYHEGTWIRVIQSLPSPPTLEEKMVALCLRYDSGGKEFKEVQLVQELLNVADAVFLQHQYLQKAKLVVQ